MRCRAKVTDQSQSLREQRKRWQSRIVGSCMLEEVPAPSHLQRRARCRRRKGSEWWRRASSFGQVALSGAQLSAAQRFSPCTSYLETSHRVPSGDKETARPPGVQRPGGVKEARRRTGGRPRPAVRGRFKLQPRLPLPVGVAALLHCTITRFLILHKSHPSTPAHAHSRSPFHRCHRILISITHTRLAPH